MFPIFHVIIPDNVKFFQLIKITVHDFICKWKKYVFELQGQLINEQSNL